MTSDDPWAGPGGFRPPAGMPYRLMQVIGEGSSAVVYRALLGGQGGEVAVKVRHGWPSGRRAEDFATECALHRRLSGHPNIVPLLDASAAEANRPWTVLPLYDFSLASVTADGGALTQQTACRWGADLLRGLAAVHDSGHVHLDVKPSNVLVSGDTAALADFGCALPLAASPRSGAGTAPGALAPELLHGSTPSTRSDVYSAALTLRRLFGPAPAPAIESLLTRAASHDPADRPADAHAFLVAFEQAIAARHGYGMPGTPRRDNRRCSPTWWRALATTARVQLPGRAAFGRLPPGGSLLTAFLAGILVAGLAVAAVLAGPHGTSPRAAGPSTSASIPASTVVAGVATVVGAPTELPRLSAGLEGRLVSSTGNSTTIRFVNHGNRRLDVFWLDPQGRRQRYPSLAPADRYEVTTSVNHPWLIATTDGTGLFVVIAAARPGLVTVT